MTFLSAVLVCFVFFSQSLPLIDCKTPQEYLLATVDENEVSLLKMDLGLKSYRPRALIVSDSHGLQWRWILKQQLKLSCL